MHYFYLEHELARNTNSGQPEEVSLRTEWETLPQMALLVTEPHKPLWDFQSALYFPYDHLNYTFLGFILSLMDHYITLPPYVPFIGS